MTGDMLPEWIPKPSIADIDSRIGKLQHAKAVLLRPQPATAKGKPGRPKGSGAEKKARNRLSAEARAKIAAAQKARWAKAKKNAEG